MNDATTIEPGRARISRAWLGYLAAGLALAAAIALVVVLAPWLAERGKSGAAPPPGAIAQLPATPEDIARKAEEGLVVAELPEDRARALNDAALYRPLGAAARPFAFSGSARDRVRARECLATALLYEAGDDALGQESVAQVVLNRVRHPAYPGTVCGVVYQGSYLRTGCQFSFTCDGSLARPWPEAAWGRARVIADRYLDGRVFAAAGLATHYHTDWVHPYWSASLEKIAKVRTHLFFRWPGWWGSRGAFGKPYRGGEPESAGLRARLIEQSEAEQKAVEATEPGAVGVDGLPAEAGLPPDLRATAPAIADAALPPGIDAPALRGNRLVLVHPDGDAFGLLVAPEASGDALISTALRLCRGAAVCSVLGWSGADQVARGFPISPDQRAALIFEYRRDTARGPDRLRFDCARFDRQNRDQCR